MCWLVLLGLVSAGCQALAPRRSAAGTRQGIQAVGGALAGRPLSPEESRRLERQIRTDPEAQAAIRKIADSMQQQPKAQYCPVGGEHYAAGMETCPIHKVKLKTIGEE